MSSRQRARLAASLRAERAGERPDEGSGDSSDSEQSRQDRSQSAASVEGAVDSRPPLCPVPEGRDSAQESQTAAGADSGGVDVPASSKKNKRKKKNRSRANSSTSAVSSNGGAGGKSVSFGHVDEIEFSRAFAFDRVPSDGSYPLGLGDEVSRRQYSVDDRISQQQAELIQRAMELGVSLERMSVEGPDGPQLSPLESRQFDYKNGKNPLFSRLSEEDRLIIL